MSDRAEVNLPFRILEAVVQGYHECSFAVHVGDKFVVKQQRGDRGPALGVVSELSKRSLSDDRVNLLNISPFGVIPSDLTN